MFDQSSVFRRENVQSPMTDPSLWPNSLRMMRSKIDLLCREQKKKMTILTYRKIDLPSMEDPGIQSTYGTSWSLLYALNAYFIQ